MINLQNIFSNVPKVGSYSNSNETSLVVLTKYVVAAIKILKSHVGFKYNLLTCITGVDLMLNSYRFLIVYELLSLNFNSRIKIKIFLNQVNFVLSLCTVFVNSNWYEREIWDLFGIFFAFHTDLRRILTDYGFEGHPLRKDFAVSGYVEVCYYESQKKVILEPLELSQEMRIFTFQLPW